MNFTYLWVEVFTVLIPFLFSFHPRLKFHEKFKSFFLSSSLVAIVFIAWDICFTDMGVWGFNPEHLLGIYIRNLPIEEVLFFIAIPFACVFTYHCLNLFFVFKWKSQTEHVVVIGLSSILFLLGILHYSKLYTSITFISLSSLLIVLKYIVQVNWLPRLLSVYLVLLIPFLIVNGILTGSGLETPVVWYNDAENLGIRIHTIPVEDVFYGLELILCNVFFYEYFNKRWSVKA